jgi:DNA topoisomerase-1
MPKNKLNSGNKKIASKAGLRYVSDDMPGIYRKKRGNGFIYLDASGQKIKDREILDRIQSLVIPPAWRDVWICPLPNGHLQVTGYDARNRKQYRYHPAWNSIRSQTKFSRLTNFAKALPAIREQVKKDLAKRSICKEKVVATVVYIMEKAYIRIGNQEYAKENGSFGLTTMRDRHVAISGSRIRFAFKGKKGVMHDIELEDKRLARIVKQCREIPGHELFQYYDEEGQRHAIDSGDINEYVHALCGEEFTAKDFRTWAGTLLAFSSLWCMEVPETKTEMKHKLNEIVKEVAHKLGNTPAVCRKYYIHPLLEEACASGRLAELYRQCSGKESAEEQEVRENILLKFLES